MTSAGGIIRLYTKFKQDREGLVPGPSAAEVSGGYFLRADGTWKFGITNDLSITYTGSFPTPLILTSSPPIFIVGPGAVSGAQTYATTDGRGVLQIAYNEGLIGGAAQLATITFNDLTFTALNCILSKGLALTSISFPELLYVGGSFAPDTDAVLTTLSTPKLKYVFSTYGPNTMAALTSLTAPELLYAGAYSPATMALLTTLNADKLIAVGGLFNPGTMASLTSLSFPALTTVGASSGGFAPTTMASLTTWSFPVLANVSGVFAPTTMGSLTSLSCNALTTITGACSVTSMASLTTISLSGMVTYGSTIAMNSGLGNVTSVTLGTIGTLKTITGATINISGQKLPSANVNAILALLVSLDGTNGTTLWGAGKTLTINGGTNGAPTGQGIVDKATLIARGATVTTN